MSKRSIILWSLLLLLMLAGLAYIAYRTDSVTPFDVPIVEDTTIPIPPGAGTDTIGTGKGA